jgi:hypothetical protein
MCFGTTSSTIGNLCRNKRKTYQRKSNENRKRRPKNMGRHARWSIARVVTGRARPTAAAGRRAVGHGADLAGEARVWVGGGGSGVVAKWIEDWCVVGEGTRGCAGGGQRKFQFRGRIEGGLVRCARAATDTLPICKSRGRVEKHGN